MRLLHFIRAVLSDSDEKLRNKIAGSKELSASGDLSKVGVCGRKLLRDPSSSSDDFESEKVT